MARTKTELRRMLDELVSDEELFKVAWGIASGSLKIKVQRADRKIPELVYTEEQTPDFGHRLEALKLLIDRKHGKADSNLNINDQSDSRRTFNWSAITLEQIETIEGIFKSVEPTPELPAVNPQVKK